MILKKGRVDSFPEGSVYSHVIALTIQVFSHSGSSMAVNRHMSFVYDAEHVFKNKNIISVFSADIGAVSSLPPMCNAITIAFEIIIMNCLLFLK